MLEKTGEDGDILVRKEEAGSSPTCEGKSHVQAQSLIDLYSMYSSRLLPLVSFARITTTSPAQACAKQDSRHERVNTPEES
jgi:hypothetical protein